MGESGGEAVTSSPDLLETGELPTHLPLLIIGRMADKSATGHQGGTQWLRLTFEH